MASAWGSERDEASADEPYAFEPLPIIAGERRLHIRAFEYWRARADGRAMPTLADCADMQRMPFAARTILIDLARGEAAARIRTVGDALSGDVQGGNAAGSGLLDELLARLPIVALQRAPIGFEAETPDGAENGRQFRGILLPLSDDEGTMAYVLGVLSWRDIAGAAVTPTVMAALASVPGAPNTSPAVVPWSLPSTLHERPAMRVPTDRMSEARTWLALAGTDRARSRAHLHAAVGAAHDAMQDMAVDESEATLLTLFGEEAAPRISRVTALARLLAIPGRELARRLDAEPLGIEGFITTHEANGEPPSAPVRLRFRLSALEPDLISPRRRRDDGSDEECARRAAR